MTIYEDEYAYWDDISSKYLMKHASSDVAPFIIHNAGFYADQMVLERRKRKREKNPE